MADEKDKPEDPQVEDPQVQAWLNVLDPFRELRTALEQQQQNVSDLARALGSTPLQRALAIQQTRAAADRTEPEPESGAAQAPDVDSEHQRHLKMYREISKVGGFKQEAWLAEHKQEFNRTSFTDYLAGRIHGQVSAEMRSRIESAIKSRHAALFGSDLELGLTRTHSDLSE